MSYADAAAQGAGQSDSDIPISHINVSEEEIEKASEEIEKKEDTFENKLDKAKRVVKDDIHAVAKGLQDPVVGSSLLVTLLAGSGASYYLVQQHKADKLTWPLGLAVGAGIIALGVFEYIGAIKYKDR